jgi:hypothetical protein
MRQRLRPSSSSSLFIVNATLYEFYPNENLSQNISIYAMLEILSD